MQKDVRNSPSAQSAEPKPQPVRSQTLRKSAVLRGFKSYSVVLTEGRSLFSPPLRLFIRSAPAPQKDSKIGFAVSRSVRSAVKRNRLKRLMREAFRRHQDPWPVADSDVSVEAVWMYVGAPERRVAYEAVETAMRKLMSTARKKHQ